MENSISLKDVSILITKGTTPTTVGGKFTKEGIKFVKSESITDFKYLNDNIFERIDQETDVRLKRSRLAEGDLLFSIAGAYLGKLAIVRDQDLPANTNQAVGIVRLDRSKVNIDYVYYFFSQANINNYLNNLSSQSSQPNLNLEQLGELKFDLKEKFIQDQIANVLSSLDNKIFLNNRINSELEQMAKTIYNYWFVQFDFPISSALADSMGKPGLEGKPYRTSGGEMVWNEELRREVPKGWEVKSLMDLAIRLNSGGTPQTLNREYYNGDIPWYSTQELQDDYLIKSINSITEKAISESSAKLFSKGTVVMAIYAAPTVGRLGILSYDSAFNQACCGILPNEKEVSKEYIFLTLLSLRGSLNKIASGTAQKNLNVDKIKNLSILVPNMAMHKKFNYIVKPLFELKEKNQKENQELSRLRDFLLPLLMNGQVRVGGYNLRQ